MKTTLTFTLLLALAAIWATGISRTAETPSHSSHCFTGLGDLADGASYSTAYGVSADGSVVIGYSSSDTGIEAFRWTRRGGMVGLRFQQALGVSADGSTVVGFRHIAGRAEPVRWTQHGGQQGLGNIAGYVDGEAHGANADGSIVVGRCEPALGRGQIPIRWTPIGGLARLGQLPNAAVEADAHAVSADGEVVVGSIEYRSGCRAAFRWTAQNGFVDLGVLPGDTGTIAYAVSADGSVIVGSSESGVNAEAFRLDAKSRHHRSGRRFLAAVATAGLLAPVPTDRSSWGKATARSDSRLLSGMPSTECAACGKYF